MPPLNACSHDIRPSAGKQGRSLKIQELGRLVRNLVLRRTLEVVPLPCATRLSDRQQGNKNSLGLKRYLPTLILVCRYALENKYLSKGAQEDIHGLT